MNVRHTRISPALAASILVLTVFSTCLMGQVQVINEGFRYRFLDFVSGDVGWMVTDDAILKTTDGGVSWNPDPWSPGGTYADPGNITDVDFINDSVGWFVHRTMKHIHGYDVYTDHLYHTTNAGESWEHRLAKNYLNLLFVSEDLVLSNHNGDTLLKSTDNGLSWEYIMPPDVPLGYASMVSFNGADTGVIVTLHDSTFHRTMDGGATWQPRSMPFQYHLTEIRFIDKLNGYFVAENWTEYNTRTYFLYKTDDAFDTWTRVAEFTSLGKLHNLHFFSNGVCIALCDNLYGESGIMRTYDGGYTWSEVESIGLLSSRDGGTFENSIEFFDHSRGFIFQQSRYGHTFQSVLKSTDQGVSWSRLMLSYPLRDICFVNDQEGFAVGGELPVDFNFGHILFTSDGGNSWNFSKESYWSLRSCDFINDTVGFMSFASGCESCTDTMRTDVYQTLDGGESWKEFEHSFHRWTRFKFLDEHLGFAGNDSGTYITRNGGDSWEILFSWEEPELRYLDVNSIVSSSENTFWSDGPDRSIIRFTSDGIWESFELETATYQTKIFFKDQYTGWISSYDEWFDPYPIPLTLFKTEDGGESWFEIESPCQFNDVVFKDSLSGWVAGKDASGKGVLLKTTDGGEEWTLEVDSLSAPLTGIAYQNGNVWAVGYNGLILKMEDPGNITAIKPDIPVPDQTDLFHLYPNPVHSVLRIEPDFEGEYSIELHDMNGRLIRSEVVRGGSRQLDLSSLHEGIYLIGIRSEDRIITKKLLKQ